MTMKKNTKIIVWSIVGLAVVTGAFFGIRSLVKKAKARKAVEKSLLNPVLPPVVVLTPLTQAEADAIAVEIKKIEDFMAVAKLTPEAKATTDKDVLAKIQRLSEVGFSYKDGRAIKINTGGNTPK